MSVLFTDASEVKGEPTLSSFVSQTTRRGEAGEVYRGSQRTVEVGARLGLFRELRGVQLFPRGAGNGRSPRPGFPLLRSAMGLSSWGGGLPSWVTSPRTRTRTWQGAGPHSESPW